MTGGGQIVLATRNLHKVEEVRRIFADVGLDVALIGLDELDAAPEVAETGVTFSDNALLKARAVASAAGLPTLAEDSGLCVDALNGMPGVLSARWSGRHGDDQANLDLVLAQTAEIPDESRGAHFVCAAALVLPSGEERVVVGRLDGRLAHAPRGTGGFGYDPIFVPVNDDRTTAEMTPSEKDAISHRGRALRAVAPMVSLLLGTPH
jgi:XTP/dITP diphosphohydrolase